MKLLFLFLKIYLLIDWLLCWVFISVLGLSLVAASGGHSSSRCAGLSLSRPLLLRSTGSRRTGSVVVAHGPSCSVACGIFPDQGSNPCPLHWQTDSQPLRHQGSPTTHFLIELFVCLILSFMSCLYILEINPVLVALFANIFSHSEGCLFVLFMVSLVVQKLLSLIRSHLFIFVFIFITLGGGSKKDLTVIYVKDCFACFPLRVL